jgi:GNAT superfamily N-acetyltransferase
MGAEVRQEKTNASIRTLRPSDAPAVTKILQQAPEAANWSGKSFEELLAWSGGVALASETIGELSGFLFGRQVGDEAEILNLAMIPDRRRLGEGGALLSAALEEFRRRGVSRVFLEVQVWVCQKRPPARVLPRSGRGGAGDGEETHRLGPNSHGFPLDVGNQSAIFRSCSVHRTFTES